MSDNYSAAADWAECDMTLPQNSTSARRGQEAGDFGRDLLVMADGLALLPEGQRRAALAQARTPVDERGERPDDGQPE